MLSLPQPDGTGCTERLVADDFKDGLDRCESDDIA
jgi:hypothetical protein